MSRSKNIPWLTELFSIRRRFFRSVEIEKDTKHPQALEGYVLTPLAEATLRRVLSGLRPDAKSRAWTLTGPYGAGKSAFALFLTQLLGATGDGGTAAALQIARNASPELTQAVKAIRDRSPQGFLRVVVSGARRDLLPALVGSLEQALGQVFAKGELTKDRQRALKELRQAPEGEDAGRAFTDLLQAVARDVVDAGGRGVVLVIDEMGKFLEHLADSGSVRGDIFLLQQIAEQASRSGDAPILVLTMLHQAFERYALRLPNAARDEWAKVQGRFEDIAFLDSSEQMLYLMSQSIERIGREGSPAYRAYDQVAKEAVERNLVKPATRDILRWAAPLHPTTALALPALFRLTLAQHERSLFSFLTSEHPGGFASFLAQMPVNEERPTSYRLDQLYDFLIATLGSALFVGGNGKRWAEIEQSLNRLGHDRPPLAARVVKVIGLLSLFGSRELRAETDILAFALEDVETTREDVKATVESLEKDSIICYRKYNQAYNLWEGSDVDLEKQFNEARGLVDRNNITDRLKELLTLDPRLARRHFIETGTLRYFEVELARPEEMEPRGKAPLKDADGRILCVLPKEEDALKEVRAQIVALTKSDKRLVVCLPRNPAAIQDAAIAWCAWAHVRETVPELAGDAVARKELAARMNAAAVTLDRALQEGFGLEGTVGAASLWFHAGAETKWSIPREVARGLSEVCALVYHQAPHIHNELLNRRSLSSAAAAARKLLAVAMVAQGREERLALEGAPPEYSMYASLLAAGHLHWQRQGQWSFGGPQDGDPLRLGPTWARIQAFLKSTEGARKPVTALYRELAEPPLGVKDGVMPVLFLTAFLEADGEIALFEDGTYLPELTEPTMERFLRRPNTFEVARYTINGARTKVVEQLADLLLLDPLQRPKPVTLVRELYQRASKWPMYTRSTRRLGEIALAVRDVMLSANDPLHLLFIALPKAVGVKLAFESESEPLFVDITTPLQGALAEINNAYGKLLQDVEHLLIGALDLRGEGPELRAELTKRAKAVKKFVTDVKLQSFVLRAGDETLSHEVWLESLATLAAGKPPMNWQDSDVDRCRAALFELGRLFVRTEDLAFDAQGIGDGGEVVELLRVSVAKYGTPEKRRVVRVHPMDEKKANEAEHTISDMLLGLFRDRPEMRLAVLGRLSQRAIEDLEAPRPQAAPARKRAGERR